jgi:ribonucleoside-diphosphate reductase alpha chain
MSATGIIKRPSRLEADVVRFQNAYEKWVAFVGLYNGRPYEIFTGKADEISMPSYIDKGEIVAVRETDKPTRYDFVFKDRDGYEITWPALSRTFDEAYWNYAKLISGILSQGIMPIENTIQLINGLKLGSDEINTWKNGVVRALKRYIPDGTVADGVVCPECGDKDLVFKEGCLLCQSCGYSKCG